MQHLRQMLFVHLQLDEHDDKLFDTLGHLICQWQIVNEKNILTHSENVSNPIPRNLKR